jgi:thiamine kinase-like enzyme
MSSIQYVKKLSETHFLIATRNGFYDINVVDYTEQELENYISKFYDSLDEVKADYKDDWYQVVAECIAEREICG